MDTAAPSQARQHAAATARPVLAIAGFALLVLLALVYARDGLALVQKMNQRAAAQSQVLVQPIGDIALRDVPKASAIQQGRWFDDPHYPGEVHWYPFATPLAAAVYANALGAPLQTAYLNVAVLFGAAALAAAGVLLYVYFGLPGLACLPVGVLLGLYWPDNATYPISTSHAPLFLLLGAAGVALASARTARLTLFLLLGALTGLLGLWHGASLVAAGFVSFCALAWAAVARLRAGAGLRAALVPWLAYGLGLAVCISPLIVPQIVRYGTLMQSDTARLFLLEDYAGGDQARALFSLRLFPRGANLVWLAIFGLSLLVGGPRAARLRRAPLAIGYLFCILFGHLGFVLHSTQYPWLARLSAALLVAPAHTFYWLSQTLLILIKLAVLGTALSLALELGRAWMRRRERPAWLAGGAAAIGGIALAASYGLLLARLPAQREPPTRAVAQATYDFAEHMSAIAGPNDAVYVEYEWGHWELMQVYPFKVVYFLSEFHRNPYAEQRRALADERLGLVGNDAARLAELLSEYHVRYVATMPQQTNVIATLCGGQLVLDSPAGYRLFRLADRCALPSMVQQAALAPNDRLGLVVERDAPVLVSGVEPGAQDNFLAFPRVPAAKRAISELRVQGRVLGGQPSCIKLRVGLVKDGQVAATREQIAHVAGAFDVRAWFITSDAVAELAPQVSFVAGCMAAGQQIAIGDVSVAAGRP